jgi:small conductance mechanosensitive channel
MLQDLKEQLYSYYDNIISLLPKLVIGLLLLVIFLWVMSFIRKKIITFARTKAQDQLLINFLESIFRINNIILGILLFLYIIGQSKIAASILGAAGVSAFVIGFAFKDIGENFLAGVIMAFSRPFRIGDTVKTGDVEGNILDMTLRETHLKTFDGKDVYVPNSQILKLPLYNYTIDGFLRKQFIIGIDYGSDIAQARNIIEHILKTTPGVIQEKKLPKTMVSLLNTNTIDITAQYWIDTFSKVHSSIDIHTNILTQVIHDLNAAKINTPGTIIEVKNYITS